MLNSENSPIQSQINRHRLAVNIQLKSLKQNLDLLVYWETIYNRENKINKNAIDLKKLIAINDILGEETPDFYFIENNKSYKNKKETVSIVIPSKEALSAIYNLNCIETEMFLLKSNIPGSAQRTIIKIKNNGNYEFILRTKHRNLEEEKIIDGNEYLLLTSQIDVNITRISTTIYSFIYKKNKYNVIINNTDKTAMLEFYESAPIPEFIKVKL